MLTSDYTIDFC